MNFIFSMPEDSRSGLYDSDEEYAWDCDLGLDEWGCWEGDDDEDDE